MIAFLTKQFQWNECRLTRTCALISTALAIILFIAGDFVWGFCNLVAAAINGMTYAAHLMRRNSNDRI